MPPVVALGEDPLRRGALATRYPKASAVIRLNSGFLGFIAISLFWIFSGILLLVGALLAFLGRKAGSVTAD